jgi:hypothetical protein
MGFKYPTESSYQTGYLRIKKSFMDSKAICVRLEVFTAVSVNNAVFWDVTQCGSCESRRFGGKWNLYLQCRKTQRPQMQ